MVLRGVQPGDYGDLSAVRAELDASGGVDGSRMNRAVFGDSCDAGCLHWVGLDDYRQGAGQVCRAAGLCP
jgi:hypothetical protein